MRFTATHEYAAAVDTVFAALTDPEVVRRKYEDNGDSDVEIVEHTDGPEGLVTVTRRVVPLDVPGFARKVLSPKNSVTQTERWSARAGDGSRTATITVDAKGVPVSVSSDVHLVPAGAGCTNTITTTIECKLPLIGGKIADVVGGSARKTVAHDESFTKAYLAEAPGG